MTDRLTALDATFLYLESPRTPMHVGSVAVFDGAPLRDEHGRIRVDDIRRVLAERMTWVPRFRKRVVAPPLRIGLPRWVDDGSLDLEHHVRLVNVGGLGSTVDLLRLASRLHEEPLDRSRPLWELWVVDGLADGAVGLIQKVHHALVDGVSGVDVATAMLDPTPEVRHPEAAAPPAPEQLPSSRQLLRDAFTESLVGATHVLAPEVVRHPTAGGGRARHLWGSLRASPLSDLVAPRCSLNQRIGDRRILDSLEVPLADAKAIAHASGATVNDVLLACVAGGLRQLFESRGEGVDLRPHALVPVSLRSDDQRLGLGNRVSGMVVPLPVDVADPIGRLRTVAATTRRLKDQDQAAFTAAITAGADRLGALVPTVLSAFVHRQPLVNLVVTNVPGVQAPLYLLGARMRTCTPIVPLARNLDVSVGILSYDGQIAFGLFADEATCPDAHVLAEGIEKSFTELLHIIEEVLS